MPQTPGQWLDSCTQKGSKRFNRLRKLLKDRTGAANEQIDEAIALFPTIAKLNAQTLEFWVMLMLHDTQADPETLIPKAENLANQKPIDAT